MVDCEKCMDHKGLEQKIKTNKEKIDKISAEFQEHKSDVNSKHFEIVETVRKSGNMNIKWTIGLVITLCLTFIGINANYYNKIDNRLVSIELDNRKRSDRLIRIETQNAERNERETGMAKMNKDVKRVIRETMKGMAKKEKEKMGKYRKYKEAKEYEEKE